MTRTLLLLAAILGTALAASTASADVVWLTTGEFLEGEVHELGNGKVRVRLGHGAITLKEELIASVEPAKTPDEIARETLAGLEDDDAEGRYAVARWAQGQQAATLSRDLLREVLGVDPDHAEARRALGYIRHEGEWVTERELHTLRGDVHYRGQWMSAEASERLRSQEAALREAREQAAAERSRLAAEQRAYEAESRRYRAESRWQERRPVVYAVPAFHGGFYGGVQPLAPFRVGQVQLSTGRYLYRLPALRPTFSLQPKTSTLPHPVNGFPNIAGPIRW